MKINFLRPAAAGIRLRAEGHVVKQGKTIAMCECDVTDNRGNLVAKANGTFMTIAVADAKFKED
jgi:uncharacterized protein (TIGR00369 family)